MNILHKALCLRNLVLLILYHCLIQDTFFCVLKTANELIYWYLKNMNHFTKEHKIDFIEINPFLNIAVPSIFASVYIFLKDFPSNVTWCHNEIPYSNLFYFMKNSYNNKLQNKIIQILLWNCPLPHNLKL